MAAGACNDCGNALEECECGGVEPRLSKTSTPYQRIARAAKRGTGVRLSAKDVQAIHLDILPWADQDDEDDRDREQERDIQ